MPTPPAPRDPATGRFRNADDRRPRSLLDVLRWQLGLGPKETSEVFGAAAPPPYHPEFAPPDLERIRQPDPGRAQATWVGHSTWLLQLGGLNLLTDPQWSQRASPLAFLGPQRLARPALEFDALPPIDAVLISHNHYDHLDLPTIRRLAARESKREGFCFYVPLGLGEWFAKRGIRAVVECGWGDRAHHPGGRHGVDLTCVPAQHWSSRSPWDRCKSLWCGWVIEAGGRKIYFAADTGWTEGVFEELGRAHGPFDLALLPIGAYSPRWFMADQHADPRDAVRIHRAVNARRSLGMHWGTFQLTDEPPAEPPLLLARALAEAGVPASEFSVLRLGETVIV